MAELESQLDLDRCPHCNVDKPSLAARHSFATKDYRGGNERVWIVYSCNRCGGAITAGSFRIGARIKECYPAPTEVSESIPGTAREYLVQAIQSLSAPAGAVMLAASSIDAMLKGRGYKSGSLYERIKNAAARTA